jgi:2'-5' RNA ligase
MPRRYLLLVLAGEAGERMQELRREWDPVMAERIDPHITLVYPQEFTDEDLLLERTSETASRTEPFEVRSGTVERSNLGGVWTHVIDDSGTWSELRTAILTPPFTPYPVTPHITIVHPRTSNRSMEALAAIDGTQVCRRCRVDEVLYAETGRNGTRVLRTFPLGGPRE